MILESLVDGLVKKYNSKVVIIGNESGGVAKVGNAKEEQSRRRLLYESNFLNGDTHCMSFDPGGKWRDRRETDGGHEGNQGNVLIGVPSCFGKIGINEVSQYKVSQTIDNFVEVCISEVINQRFNMVEIWGLISSNSPFRVIDTRTYKAKTANMTLSSFCMWHGSICGLLHFMRVNYGYCVPPLVKMEIIYAGEVSMDVRNYVVMTFGTKTLDPKVFASVIVVINFHSGVILQHLIILQNIMADLHAFVIIMEPTCETIGFWKFTTPIENFKCQVPLFDSTRKSSTSKYVQDCCLWNSVECNLPKAAKEEIGNRLKHQGGSYKEGISKYTFDDQIVIRESFQSNGNDLLARVYATVGSSNTDHHNTNDSDSQGAVNIGIQNSKLKVVEYYKLALNCYYAVEIVTRQFYPLLEGSMRILLNAPTVVRNALIPWLSPHSTLTFKFGIQQVVKNWNMTVAVHLKLGLIIVFLADRSFIPMVDGILFHGDNVGNIVGMGSNLFSSFVKSSCACLILTRGRAIPWEGWHDVTNPNGQLWKTSKLFHKLMNGLDPPMDLYAKLVRSQYGFLRVRSKTSFLLNRAMEMM